VTPCLFINLLVIAKDPRRRRRKIRAPKEQPFWTAFLEDGPFLLSKLLNK